MYSSPKKGFNITSLLGSNQESVHFLGSSNITLCDWRGMLKEGMKDLHLSKEKTTLYQTEEENSQNETSIILKVKFPEYPNPIYFDYPSSTQELDVRVPPNFKNINFDSLLKLKSDLLNGDCLSICDHVQQTLLWKFRYNILQNDIRLLPKVLMCVNYSISDHRKSVYELLYHLNENCFETRIPISITLLLLDAR